MSDIERPSSKIQRVADRTFAPEIKKIENALGISKGSRAPRLTALAERTSQANYVTHNANRAC